LFVFEFIELDGEMQRIAARIFVDKTSQKSIVIGNKGEMLKLIGTGKYFRINVRSVLVSGLLNAESGNKSSG
jgi:GTPase Era involved in 16S rRNA processing